MLRIPFLYAAGGRQSWIFLYFQLTYFAWGSCQAICLFMAYTEFEKRCLKQAKTKEDQRISEDLHI